MVLLIKNLIKEFVAILFKRPRLLMDLLHHKECYSGQSYYPEMPSRPKWKNFLYQVGQIMKYGRKNDYFYMYGLDVKSDQERAEYVNFKQFFDRICYLNVDSNRNNSTCILRNKLYFDIFAKGIGVKTPKIRAYYSQGQLYIWDGKFIKKPFSEISNFPDTELFCKETDGECGAGIFILKINKGELSANGKIVSPDQLEQMITGAEYLFQEIVQQHPKMSELYSGSINTIRLVTVRSLKDNQLHLMPSILRIGANGSFVDNTSQGGIAVGFNLDTGQLNRFGFQKPQFGFKSEVHPNSGVRFSEFFIPQIKEAEQMALHFHSMLKDLQSIGWDIAIGPDGPIFIEGNDNWEINGPQVGNHGLRKEFEEYFY